MASQTDYDQGGTRRHFERRWLGPSVGWVLAPVENVLPVTAVGVTSPVNGTTLITLNIAGLVTIQLWDPTVPTIPANSIPGPSLGLPLVIVDIGGNCSAATPATLLPAAGKTIMGLASIDIANPYGSFTLLPNIVTGNWDQQL